MAKKRKKQPKYDVQIGEVQDTTPRQYDVSIGDVKPLDYNVQVGRVVPSYELDPMEFSMGDEKQEDPYADSILKMIEAKKSRRDRIRDLDSRIAMTSLDYDRGFENMLFEEPRPTKRPNKAVNDLTILREQQKQDEQLRHKRLEDAVEYSPSPAFDKKGLLDLPRNYMPDKSRGFPMGINPNKLSPDDRLYWGI